MPMIILLCHKNFLKFKNYIEYLIIYYIINILIKKFTKIKDVTLRNFYQGYNLFKINLKKMSYF